MPEATLRVPDSIHEISAGALITWFTPTDTDGDEFANTSGTVMVLVKNDSTTLPVTVTVVSPQPCSRGYYHDVVAEVALGTTWGSTILAADLFAVPETGITVINCSAVTDVKMALIQLSFVPDVI